MNITQNTDLYDCSILRLTLQPIVENCIKHGFSFSIDEGLIALSFYKADDIVKISISDNGIGLSNKRIAELNNILNDAPNSHGKYFSLNKTDSGKGLKNVNIRLKLFYGSEYGIHFVEAVKGTAVEIIIPYIKKEEKNEAVDC